MPYVKKTVTELSAIILQQVSSELGLDVALIDDASLINIISKTLAAVQTEQYADLEYQTRQAFPSLADEEGIREWGAVKEIEWVTSRISAGTVDATGTNGSVIVVGTELTRSSDSAIFLVTVEATIAAGVAVVSVESQEGGEDKNMDSGEVLTFVSTPVGVDNSTTVTIDGLTGGSDTWTLAQYSEAVNASFSAPARGGSDSDYEYWTKQELDAAYVWPYAYSSHPADIAKGDVEIYFTMDVYDVAGVQATGDITITGTDTTVIPIGTVFTAGTLIYTSTTAGTIGAVTPGEVDVTVECNGIGLSGNQLVWTPLAFQTPIAGADDPATVSVAITGGAGASIPPLSDRTRVLAYLEQYKPLGMGELTCPPLVAEGVDYDITIVPNTTTIQDAVLTSLQTLHAETEPGGTITTGQMNRAISDTTGVIDFILNSPTTIQSGTERYNLLTVNTPTWS